MMGTEFDSIFRARDLPAPSDRMFFYSFDAWKLWGAYVQKNIFYSFLYTSNNSEQLYGFDQPAALRFTKPSSCRHKCVTSSHR